jgi:uncharacterized protein YceK
MKRSGQPPHAALQTGRFRLALALPLTLLLSGCLTLAAVQRGQEEQTADRLRSFNAEDHAWALGGGADVSGSVVLDTLWSERSYGRQLPGVRKILTCEGRLVRLIPDTAHMRWILARDGLKVDEQGYWTGSSIMLAPDWRWPVESRAVVRETTCGAGGAFRFDDVPDGRYLVLAMIPAVQEWETTPDLVLKPVQVRAQGGTAHVDVRLEDNWLTGAVVRH